MVLSWLANLKIQREETANYMKKVFFFFHIYTIYAYSDQGKVIWVARGIDEINTGLHWNRHFYGYINWNNQDGFILSQIDYFDIENGNKPMLNFYP